MGKQWKTAGKQAQASKKGALFTKLSREIQVAVRLSGPHPENNPRLKLSLETARSHHLPKDTIERAIAKGAGQKREDQIEEVFYEGFGPHGTAILVHCLTDNRTRTVSEIRHLFKKQGGNLGEGGSVMWMFDKVAFVQTRKEGDNQPNGTKAAPATEVSMEEVAISAGAWDLKEQDDSYIFYGKWENLHTLRDNLIKQGLQIIKAGPFYRAKNKITLDAQKQKEVLTLLKFFEENPDCKAVYTNMETT